jgi:glycosyltransferase involved in cell wall biosynthesis
VPNGITMSLYPPSGQVDRDIDVLGVGSLIPLKQYDLFLSVIAQLSIHLPGVRAILCGGGPEEARLQTAVRELQLGDQVVLTGEQPHDAVLRLMQRSRVFLHTSSYEGFSTVCLEALYAGAHVVSLCHPMPFPVKHWHIADGPEELAGLALGILEDPGTDHEPVLVYSMDESARKMMQLFDYSE